MTSARTYGLLGVDVDGTLVWDGSLAAADVAALRAAARAGVAVCVCTGRAWNEVRSLWQALDLPAPHAPVVCVGGALVVEPATGRSLYSRSFDLACADELARAFGEWDLPVMALVDAWREGFDYYMLGDPDARPMYRRFFASRPSRIRRADRLDAPDMRRPLRISVLTDGDRADQMVRTLRRRLAGRIEVQAIHLRSVDVHIVEAFAAGANKFTALRYVGQGLRIGPARMAAIGDDHNDLPMLQRVGFSAAPADAPADLRQAASVTVAARGQRPVAQFVDLVLNAPPGVDSDTENTEDV